MGSFRKRLLVLIIGLSVVTQTVTLAAVLIGTRRTVEARAAEQLRSGGSLAEQLIGFRAGQLANGVAVLAADFGFREAVASGDAPTILSAARNNAQRIGADMVLLLDTHGRVLTSTAPAAADAAGRRANLRGGPRGRVPVAERAAAHHAPAGYGLPELRAAPRSARRRGRPHPAEAVTGGARSLSRPARRHAADRRHRARPRGTD